ncbi:MAG: STAS domain-containing protein [Actinobacteria bacterium]|nr:STAS domain-containing protein [Actinomycetota bacterium]MBW3649969.1 STAS domain-containing protein [Actinomycetota bacterium]
MFAIRIEMLGSTAICRVQGDADAANAPALRECVVALTEYRKVILDFSGVAFIDSAGLGCLIAGVRRIRAADGDVVLCSARRAVHRVLQTVGMDRVLPIVATIDEALAVLEATEDVVVEDLGMARSRTEAQELPA